MRTQNITVAKIRREYWDRIQQGGKRFEIRNEPISDMSTMIVFEDADTGEHLGNARVLERHRFGLMPPHGHGRCSPNWLT